MRIIKPYGRSHAEWVATGSTRRVLRERSNPEAARDITEFARSHDRLVIAQWVSVIDKIASKPAGTTGPTSEQREFRDRLGQAAWTFLEANKVLSGLGDPAGTEFLAKIWKAKIAPYGSASYRAPNRPGKAAPSARGRWYERFAGNVAVSEVDAAAVARKIHEHLYLAEYRNAGPKRAQGSIIARARSIAVNVPHTSSHAPTGWTEDDQRAYARAGNVAQEIREAVRQREKGEDKAGTRRVSIGVAAAVLFRHYARLFCRPDGTAFSIREARERVPGLLNLHTAVKDCCARLIDHQRKSRRPGRGPRSGGPPTTSTPRSVADTLPESMEMLFALVERKSANRDLNALVRIGKIIHYTASGNREDRTAGPIEHWPSDITDSFFWTSDGQAVIKRNEAFVRIWRHALAFASRTLMDWADPEGTVRSDILLRRATEHAVQNLYGHERYRRKVDLLFGNRAHLFKRAGDDAFERGVLRFALEGTAELRNSAFHFKGLGDFADALTGARLTIDAAIVSAVRVLWEADVKERAGGLPKAMRAALLDHFLNDAQALKFATACAAENTTPLPLPRFARLLRRAANAWSEGENDLHLPKPANRIELQNPGRMCQYAALKLLYELAFRSWLHRCTAAALNEFIDRAVMRSTIAARNLNARDDAIPREVIVAKAAALSRVPEDGSVETFFFDLSAETATEMRVQRGYCSDPDAAREQAAYIENLKCDVVALAFRRYLKEADFEFLLDFSAEMRKPDTPFCDLARLPMRQPNLAAEPWQVLLYFIIHLVPVEEIGQLLHQLRKWEILAGKRADSSLTQDASAAMKARVAKLQGVLELYLDMHDAKFQGGAALIGTEGFKVLFESEELFDRLFPPGESDDRRIPRRGLREITRFGHLGLLRPLFQRHPIKHGEVMRYLEDEALQDGKSRIAQWQESREALHEKWTREGREFPLPDIRSYVDALSNVVRHRHLASHVTLTDHVKLHRLLMTLLGRLVDYAALWERDLFFATLGLIHDAGGAPAQVFTPEGLRFLRAGRIARALRKSCWQTSPQAQAVADGLRRHFGSVFDGKSIAVRIRNDFAHFNMVKPRGPVVDMTEAVNAARYLVAYDRKLKNAVSQSIKEKLQREGLTLNWTLDESTNHYLGPATLQTRQARHLGRTVLRERGSPGAGADRRPRSYPIAENIHSDEFVGMVASLFARCTALRQKSSLDLPFDRIEWRPSGGQGEWPRRGPPDTRRDPKPN